SHSKHLRVTTMFCCGQLKTNGFTGFRDGVQLVAGLVQQFWPTLYPLLDPEDNNDPTQRLNLLGALTPRRESMGFPGWLRFAEYLSSTPLCQPKGAPPITLEQLQAAKLKAASLKEGGNTVAPDAPDLGKLEAALRQGSEQVALNHAALREALESINAL